MTNNKLSIDDLIDQFVGRFHYDRRVGSMTDIDEKLCEAIAAIWIIWGGDSEGFEWCYKDIIEKIKEKESHD